MIIIIGDSWGLGEWSSDNTNGIRLSGPGIGNYLSLHDKVINLSVGGGSNTDSLDRLELLFEQFTPDPFDEFFWIVTCPSRCFTQFYNTSFTDYAEQHLYKAFNRANTIAHNMCINIELIGGVCDLISDYVEHFECLKLRVPSWGKLIDSSYPSAPYAPSPEILNKFNIETDVIDNLEKKYKFWKNSNYFPDNGHPNSIAHKLLQDYIFPDWSHKY